MGEIRLTRELVALGWTSNELARAVRSGQVVRPRRGAYVLAPPADPPDAPPPILAHRRLIEATLPQLRLGSVVSHASAAVLHGLPVPYSSLRTVDVTRDPGSTGRIRGAVHAVAAELPAEHVSQLDGVWVTTPARTVVDLARHGRFDWGLAAADAALRQGLQQAHIDAVLQTMRRWPGVRRARRVRMEADPRAESAGESILRARIIEASFARPVLQLPMIDGRGRRRGFADLGWPGAGVVAEFDGMVKYQELVPEGQTPSDVVVAEKIREDAFRARGWTVARFIWEDLWRPHRVIGDLNRAFALARHRGHLPPPAST